MKRARIFRWRERPHLCIKHVLSAACSTSRADRFMQGAGFLVNKNKNNVKMPEFKKQFIFV
jgi:hypothetical protein